LPYQNNNTMNGMSSRGHTINTCISRYYHYDLPLFYFYRQYQYREGKGLGTSGITHHSPCCRKQDVKSSITTTTT
jgi:hypothetical protein